MRSIVFRHTDQPELFELGTGFKDKHGKLIYEGDLLSDFTEVDGEKLESKNQVFWCQKFGAWMLDMSFHQDRSYSDLLGKALIDFEYEITGNIHKDK